MALHGTLDVDHVFHRGYVIDCRGGGDEAVQEAAVLPDQVHGLQLVEDDVITDQPVAGGVHHTLAGGYVVGMAGDAPAVEGDDNVRLVGVSKLSYF